jgi:2-polyprenyl-6-methoxyphenol hydroxylase-like FAD-dependent oxidoreductase
MTIMAEPHEQLEVLICGGGPVGLLIAYGLQRMNIKTCVIGKNIDEEHGGSDNM